MAVITKSSGDLIETNVDDETIIVSLESGQLYSVKGTSAAIWRLIDGSRNKDQIIAQLANDYGQTRDQISADIEEFLQDAAEVGLLSIAGGLDA